MSTKFDTFTHKFGIYGGRFVPETLTAALDELELAFFNVGMSQEFKQLFNHLLTTYVGRPTPLTYASRLSDHVNGARIYLKREDLAHTGAHKINNALGQALLAKRMKKKRIIAETGAGQHGVAAATVSALLGLKCVVYMGTVDIARQSTNVQRMKLLGADVVPVDSGSKTLKDAVNEALRDWVTNVDTSYYLLGSALGPHPYPIMVREFQSMIGNEARSQFNEMTGKDPDICIACVGGGSNSIGMFQAFLDTNVRLIGVEAGGEGISSKKHASRFSDPSISRPGVLHGTFTFVMQNDDGQIYETHSISAGLDYPAVGPEHSYLREIGRVEYTTATDVEALQAFSILSKYEGILAALESSHAIAEAIKIAPNLPVEATILVNVSGRGDKDLNTIVSAMGMEY